MDNYDRALLDALLEKEDVSTSASDIPNPASFRYRLTHLKRISQSMQPLQIKERVGQFTELKQLFSQLAPLISRLGLSDETIRYYAQYVPGTQSSTLALRTHERYGSGRPSAVHRLHCAPVPEHRRRLDSHPAARRVTALLNDCQHEFKEEQFRNRFAPAQLVHQVTRRSDVHIEALSEIERIVEQTEVDDGQKVERIN